MKTVGSVIDTEGQIANSRGYDDSWSSTQLWRSIGNISRLINKSTECDAPVLDSKSYRRAHREVSSNSANRHEAFGMMLVPITIEVEKVPREEGGRAEDAESAGAGGACYALCPPMMGFGVCFNMPSKTPPGNCSAVLPLAGSVCPAHGNPRQCQTPPLAEDTSCETILLDGKPNCTLVGTGCQMLEGAGDAGLLPSNNAFRFATCICHPTQFEAKQVTWTPEPCVYTPYTPPSPIGIPSV
eukprot:SAG31_NODE_3237_length_4508_cov_28.486278_4_plen_241_part_00